MCTADNTSLFFNCDTIVLFIFKWVIKKRIFTPPCPVQSYYGLNMERKNANALLFVDVLWQGRGRQTTARLFLII